MAKRILIFTAVVSALIGLLISCTLSGMSDVEFAKELMVESTDATGLYDISAGSKSGGSTGGESPITITLPPENAPETGPYLIDFSDFTPSFAPNSVVNGTVEVTLAFDPDSDPPTLTITFNSELTVVGEHAGIYYFSANLIIDLSTGEYTYSGDIVIDDKVYKTS